MKLGISGQALGYQKSLEEILLILKKNEVSNIELWESNFNGGINDDTCILNIKELLRQYDINAVCVSMDWAFNKEKSDDIKGYSEMLKRTVEVANELGAKLVNHYCYYLALSENFDLSRLMQYYEGAIKKAEELGVYLALENEAHDATRTPMGTLKILNAVNSKYFKTNYDATNYYHGSCEGFPYAYEVLKEHIVYVHIKNGIIFNQNAKYLKESIGTPMSGANEGNLFYYPTIANGAVNIHGLLLRLKNDGYEGFCTLEPHTSTELVEMYYEEEVKYVKSLGLLIGNCEMW